MIGFYVYLIIGLLWFLIISIYNWREFNGLKFLIGICAYPLLYPLFFYFQLKKAHIFKKTIKDFNTFKFLLFNDYGPKQESNKGFGDAGQDFSSFTNKDDIF